MGFETFFNFFIEFFSALFEVTLWDLKPGLHAAGKTKELNLK